MLKVVIVEDSFMIADMAEDTLLRNGYGVCGIASTVAEGLALCRQHDPDLAIIDLRLADGELGTEIAAQLVPFGKLGILYVTGNSDQLALSGADGHGCLGKPYLPSDLLRGLQLVTDLVKTGRADPPYPAGFHLLGPADSSSRTARS